MPEARLVNASQRRGFEADAARLSSPELGSKYYRRYSSAPAGGAVNSRVARVALIVAAVFVVTGAIGAFVMFGPPHVAATFAEPTFCASCHIMENQYEAFEASVHSRLDSCNDCHLPNTGFVRHYAAEAFVGARDLLYWNLNRIPEHIEARERSRHWIQENCVRCHRLLLGALHPAVEDRWCWECHRQIYHDYETRTDPDTRRRIWED